MGVIDAIVKDKLVDGPLTVNTDFTSDVVDVSGVEDTFSVQMDFSNGNGSVDIKGFLEVSVNDQVYVPITDTEFLDTDDSGTMLWEVTGRGVNYLRVKIEVTAGQFDIDNLEFSGSRRH